MDGAGGGRYSTKRRAPSPVSPAPDTKGRHARAAAPRADLVVSADGPPSAGYYGVVEQVYRRASCPTERRSTKTEPVELGDPQGLHPQRAPFGAVGFTVEHGHRHHYFAPTKNGERTWARSRTSSAGAAVEIGGRVTTTFRLGGDRSGQGGQRRPDRGGAHAGMGAQRQAPPALATTVAAVHQRVARPLSAVSQPLPRPGVAGHGVATPRSSRDPGLIIVTPISHGGGKAADVCSSSVTIPSAERRKRRRCASGARQPSSIRTRVGSRRRPRPRGANLRRQEATRGAGGLTCTAGSTAEAPSGSPADNPRDEDTVGCPLRRGIRSDTDDRLLKALANAAVGASIPSPYTAEVNRTSRRSSPGSIPDVADKRRRRALRRTTARRRRWLRTHYNYLARRTSGRADEPRHHWPTGGADIAGNLAMGFQLRAGSRGRARAAHFLGLREPRWAARRHSSASRAGRLRYWLAPRKLSFAYAASGS